MDYLRELSLNDIIITSRYHAAIFGLCYSIPVICLSIDPKLDHLVEEVPGFSIWKPKETMEHISELVNNALKNYDESLVNISESYSRMNERAEKSINFFINEAKRD